MATLRIQQRIWLRGQQSFEIRESEDFVRVATKFGATFNEFQIPLNIIHPEPDRLKHVNVPGIICMVIFGSLSLLMIVLAFGEPAFLMMVAVFLAITFAGFIQFKKESVDARIFRSRTNGQTVLAVWQDSPSKDEFDLFTNGMRERLRNVDVPINNPQAQSVADELRKLGELRKEGVISSKEFDEAKAQLLNSLGKREIGFK